ncbi:tautomerase [Campylobacterota bacterium DY0563]
MPHLQFEINKKIENNIKEQFIADIQNTFAQVMETKTDHIAISIREYDKYSISIGRTNSLNDICLMNLDIREGRNIEQRRELALRFMDIVYTLFKVDNKNQYITFTEHKGEDFHLVEKYLSEWKIGEDPLV